MGYIFIIQGKNPPNFEEIPRIFSCHGKILVAPLFYLSSQKCNKLQFEVGFQRTPNDHESSITQFRAFFEFTNPIMRRVQKNGQTCVKNLATKGSCSIVGKPLYYLVSERGSILRRSHTTRSPPRAARLTQPSIFPRSINEYRIIPGLIPGHQR